MTTRAGRLLLAAAIATLLLGSGAPSGAQEPPAAWPPVSVTGVESERPVHPPPGHALSRTSRDCGYSAPLSDGRTFWVFCDTSDAAADGSGLTYFLNNTAGVAEGSAPYTPIESARGNVPYQFLSPAQFLCRAGESHVLWPKTVTVVPRADGVHDRVLVYFDNVCAFGPTISDTYSAGVGLGEYWYTPGQSVPQPIVGRVILQRMWSGETFGDTAALGPDGYIYLYSCEWRWGYTWGCRVGRVAWQVVTSLDQYRYWNGSGWAAGEGAASLIPFDGADEPGVALEVDYVPALGLWAMSYVGWPGIGEQLKVRFAASPQGPWSPTQQVNLPGCTDPGYFCYAGSVHGHLSTRARLSVGYYDQYVPFSNRAPAGQVKALELSISAPATPPTVFSYWSPGDAIFVGDWNGDGRDTPGVRHAGVWYLSDSAEGTTVDRVAHYGLPGDEPVVGDWNGDGRDSLGVRRSGHWYLTNSLTGGVAQFDVWYGFPGDEALVGDWDGDGDDTIGVRRDARWYLRDSLVSGVADYAVWYGYPGDDALIGDWNNDGRDTPGVRRDARWYLSNSFIGGIADYSVWYGFPGDESLIGDWNGDGADSPGLVRGLWWYLANSFFGGSADISFQVVR